MKKYSALLVLFLAACDSGTGGNDPINNPDDPNPDKPPIEEDECPRVPGDADRERFVVVSYPVDENAQPALKHRVLALDTDGTLGGVVSEFDLGAPTSGEIAFTPDGAIGIAATEDGGLGVFALDASGVATVVHDNLKSADFWASRVFIDATGKTLYVVNSQWREHGGGISAFAIGCDGALTFQGDLVSAKLPRAVEWLDADRVLVAAVDLGDSAPGEDLHEMSLSATNATRKGSVDIFTDDDYSVSDLAVSPDGKWALLGDNSGFSAFANRVALVELTGSMTPKQTLSIEDPYSIEVSPFGNLALVVSGFTDSLFALTVDPVMNAEPITYTGGKPQVPGTSVMIRRGALAGRVILTEVEGLRQVQMTAEGAVNDLGVTKSPVSGMPGIPGALGVTP